MLSLFYQLTTIAESNPIRGAYFTYYNEIRRLVVRASTVFNQSNSLIAIFFNSFIAQNRVPAIRTRNMNIMAAIHDTGMTHFY